MNTNRLAGETSPYLLQHAHNPVDWYPWGPEAFDRARREDRPIFLSVGYSTCYWCHVMERQSFESEAVAAVLNEHFVSVKVDREERPDVDQLYMTGVQVQTRHGGWPMSVFLTPDLQYFYGGTYFPPDDAYGRPGFVSLLLGIADAWKHRHDEVMGSARQFTRILSQLAHESASAGAGVAMTRELIAGIVDGAVDDHDARLGGFGGAPKFPRQTLLELIFAATEEASAVRPLLRNAAGAERALRRTLDAMMYGGIRDQLGGGFHRYSTDAKWLVPHFEIMLYDNAMLGRLYAAAARRWGEARYATVARELFDFVLRAMTSPTGAFYTAFDAEVDAREGEPYLWTEAEARAALADADPAFSGSEIDLFCRVFGLDQGPNFADPHGAHHAPHANVLFVADPEAFHANTPVLDAMRRRLLDVRAARKQPLLDTKVITSWNALMIGAMAEAGTLIEEPRYVTAAARAADDVLAHHLRPDGALLRTSRNGRAKTAGFLDDYAGLADALLSLHAATREPRWHAAAERMAAEMLRRFADPAGGALYFTDATADELIVRQKTGTDSPLPAGNALAAKVLLRLGDAAAAGRIVAAFGEPLTRFGEGLATLASVAESYLRSHDPIPADGAVPSPEPEMAVVRASARRAGDAAIEVDVEVAEGFHLHANPAAEGYVPTTLNAPSELPAEAVTIVYPPGRPWRADFARDEIPVYSGRFAVRMNSRQPFPPGRISLALRFQACDASACRLPETVRVEVA